MSGSQDLLVSENKQPSVRLAFFETQELFGVEASLSSPNDLPLVVNTRI